ncbi:MAG: amidohydrolase family protein [Candidatus Cloacimonadaceae bacterium]|jgi:predicted amidohydrolase YtcJ|nr:amidohydrolase family protein [Candidatus Cloacimonadota bacterium]MCK9177734.1 amidohydrolase family protein [Candidatus Cloacimonadota bacterium]MDD3532515.1 amidohydrolase family protein [Candidatus Cloacimonadota bacterium]MDY0126545.1 amidohydrolase family protein [Candidatus Cloacimonadaceae bacterium]
MKIFYNAKFWHKSSFDNGIVAILTDQSKILKLLSELPESTQDYELVDLKGNYVYPGFIDTHTHSFEGGLYSLMINLGAARSLQDVFDLISEGMGDKGRYIFAWNFDEQKTHEGRFPTRAELDAVVKDKNLVLRRVDGHSCIINSFACDSILGGMTKVHCENEVFKGFENDKAVHWFHNSIESSLVLQAYHAASELALKAGFTTIHTMVGDANMSIGHYSLIQQHIDEFGVDFVLYPQSFNIEAALEVGARRIGGCILADGSLGSYTAALYEPYKGQPIRGNLYQSDSYWHDFITRAHQNNLQVGVHCIGDRAITQINSVYMALANSDYKDLRHQLIHCELTDDALVNQIKASGAVPVMQPMFDQLWGGDNGFYAKVLGQERARKMNRYATMLSRGIKITGSSDWYVTELDIIKSLEAAMNHHNPSEALTAAQAVDIYTKNAAWLSHDEAVKGQLLPGLMADFTVMNYDLSQPGTDQRVVATIKAGMPLYEDL